MPAQKAALFFYQCGCCDQYHHALFTGDCRDDANRFNPEDLPNGWQEITQEEADDVLALAARVTL